MIATVVGLTPYILIAMGLVFMGFIYALERFPTSILGDTLVDLVGIGIGVVLVLLLVSRLCLTIHPQESFVDGGTDPVVQLLQDIGTAEKDVCDLITRTDKFIQNDVGKPGHDNPQLVSDAQQKARDAVGSPLTDCQASWTLDVSGDAAIQEADNRLTRMEDTLKSFTGPELQATYDKSVKCEGFQSGGSLSALQDRLVAVKTTITTQQQKLLKPIDDKTAALQKGEVSDCDKKRGGNVAVVASTTGKTPNRG